MTSRIRRLRSQRSDDRGATLVEYALLAALVAVVLLGVLQFVTDEGTDELEARADRSGSPDLASTGVTAPPSGGGGGGTPSSVPTSPPIAVQVSSLTGCWAKQQNTWTANFVVTVTNTATGEPVNEAIVRASMRKTRGDGADEGGVTPDKETLSDGTAPFSLVGLVDSGQPDQRTATVTFELLSITGVDPPIIYTLPSPPPSVIVDRNVPAGECT